MSKFIAGEGGSLAVTESMDSIPVSETPEYPTVDANYTQVITTGTNGAAVQGPNVSNTRGWFFRTGAENIYFMAHGQTKAAKGFLISANTLVGVTAENLSELDFAGDVTGAKLYAVKL